MTGSHWEEAAELAGEEGVLLAALRAGAGGAFGQSLGDTEHANTTQLGGGNTVTPQVRFCRRLPFPSAPGGDPLGLSAENPRLQRGGVSESLPRALGELSPPPCLPGLGLLQLRSRKQRILWPCRLHAPNSLRDSGLLTPPLSCLGVLIKRSS